jgi:hypothetical protein
MSGSRRLSPHEGWRAAGVGAAMDVAMASVLRGAVGLWKMHVAGVMEISEEATARKVVLAGLARDAAAGIPLEVGFLFEARARAV